MVHGEGRDDEQEKLYHDSRVKVLDAISKHHFLTFDQIQTITGLSSRTVAKHLEALQDKDEVKSRTGGVRWGREGPIFVLDFYRFRTPGGADPMPAWKSQALPPRKGEGRTIGEYTRAFEKWDRSVKRTDGRGRNRKSIPLPHGSRRVKFYYIPSDKDLPAMLRLESSLTIMAMHIKNLRRDWQRWHSQTRSERP